MKMLRAAALIALVGTAGCYHAVIDTGRPPSGETITEEWAHSFIVGLVPPDVVETAERCPNGVARVETQHSFLNQLANFITFGIYSPMTIEVACASAGGEEPEATALQRVEGVDARELLSEAARRSAESGEPVYVEMR